METVLTVLLVVGGILFKVYENYKEEMEKSKKRMQQMQDPKAPEVKETYRRPEPRQPVIVKKVQDTRIPTPIQNYASTHQKVYSKTAGSKLGSTNNRHSKQLGKTEPQNTENVKSFDLREAIIQQAILERPYIN